MFIFSYFANPAVANTPTISPIVDEVQSANTLVSKKPLASQSLQITTKQDLPYVNWSEKNHADTFKSLQKTIAIWKEKGIAEQYLVYGKHSNDERTFSWEIVPYQKQGHFIGRIWQQLSVLWGITFGGTALTEPQKQKQVHEYKAAFDEFSPHQKDQAERVAEATNRCAFCSPEVINKQSVLEGKSIRVLYNYAPIGFGGERLHFLVVPKAHKSKFNELSEEEYLETTSLTQQLIKHFDSSETRSIQDVYLFHKTGKDAGQTVPHWHMHVVLTSNKAQDFFGKLTVFKNMLFASSPMKVNELREKVKALKHELNPLHAKGD